MSFLNELTGFGSKVALSHFAIGSFTLDAIDEESFESSVTLTESAIESGARLSDHKIKNPRVVLIRGVIVNYETKDTISQIFPQSDALLNRFQLPVSVSAITEYTRATVNRYAGVIKKYAQTASRVYDAYNKLGTVKSITDIPSLLNDDSETDDRITKIKNTLDSLCFSDELLTITTSTGQYTKVSVLSYTLVRVGVTATVAITLREVPTFDVEMVGGINAVVKSPTKKVEENNKPATENKTDKAKTQSAKPQNKGKTQPQKTKESAIVSMRKYMTGA